MDSLSFRIPEQQPPGGDAFDTRLAAVQRWVEELPMGHIGETAKRLYEMLREVNRLKLPLKTRFELIEEVRTPLHTVLESLERHYSGMPFPLAKKSLRVAQFSTGLLHEVVIAYQAVLNSEENASWFYRMTNSKLWLATVHRLIHYLNRILNNYRLIHRTPPGGVWLAVHRLYWAARENRRHRDKLTAPLGSQTMTIEGEYKRALLLAMVQPQLLSREQMVQVDHNMPQWLQHCVLVDADKRRDQQPGFCIRREADAPHTAITQGCCSDCDGEKKAGLLFDLNELELHLVGLLERLGEEDAMVLAGGGSITRETLETLRDSWRAVDSNRHERIRSDAGVEVAIGMNSIFQLLQGQLAPLATGISNQKTGNNRQGIKLLGQNEDKAQQNRGVVMGKRPEKDVWGTIFHATEISQKSWSREADEREYQFVGAQQRDYTDSGYCLEFDQSQMQPLQVGELMGVRAAAAGPLQLCMVRWLNDDEKSITTGLMRMASSMEPVLIVAKQEGRKTVHYCLLGIGEDQRPQLFLPHLPGIRSRELFLVVDEKEVALSLDERVVLSPLFDAFHFHAALIPGDEQNSLEGVNRQLRELVHPRKKERPSEDYSDLWSSL